MTEEKQSTGLDTPRPRKNLKRIVYSLLAGAAIAGTYSAHNKDCPPFYVNKTGTSGGLCVGVVVDIEKGAKFYGSVVSLHGKNEGEINGLRVGIINLSDGGKLNGLEAGVVNGPYETKTKTNNLSEKVNGLQVGVVNIARNGKGLQVGLINDNQNSNGLQVGLANVMRDGNGLQVGVMYNQIRNGKGLQVGLANKAFDNENNYRWGVGLNYSFSGKTAKDKQGEQR